MRHNKVTPYFALFQLLYMNLQILIIFLLKVAEGSGLKLAFRMLLLWIWK